MCRKASPLGLTHSGCKTPHVPDGLISFYDYHDKKISKAIIDGKYHFIHGVYTLMGKLLAQNILEREYKKMFLLAVPASGKNQDKKLPDSSIMQALDETTFHLIPIPLAASRQRWRGFNQAEVLCKSLSAELGLPIANILLRKKITRTQKDLKRSDRIKNMEGAFTLSPLYNPTHNRPLLINGNINSKDFIKPKNFILVDDVITTGSTLLEAVKVLKRNGANQVWCLTIAKD